MRRLADAREHLDGALADPDVLDGNLRDLRRINRQLGGSSLSLRAIAALVGSSAAASSAAASSSVAAGDAAAGPLRVLDVGAGACDISLALSSAAGPWPSVRVTAVDRRREVLDAARRVTPGLDGREDLRLELADGRALPYPDGAFDVAHASLVVHHLDGREAVGFLRELARVARIGIVINDLERGWLPWLGAWLVLHAMTRNAFTLHDGPLSVRRSYTAREMRSLLAEAGLRPVAQASGFAGHRWAIAAEPRRGAVPT
jgi:ubiquinone/menaquinone biosynthesis C-methylase UbiE